MASDRQTFVFRVQGLPASLPDATLTESLNSIIVSESPGEQMGHNVRVSILPSCYDNGEQKVALVEFEGRWPEFLSTLKRDRLGEEDFQMGQHIISFDCHFHGFTQLYPSESDAPLADIIAITGLDGHAYGSWKSKGRLAKMWLRHFLSEDLPNCRTMIYGYNSKLLIRGNKTILEYGRGFLNELKKIRNTDELRRRPIVFIAHSFGGIILAHCLVRAVQTTENDDATISTLYNATYGMLLFGIPHKGLIVDDIERMIAHEVRHPAHSLLREIKSGSSTLALQSVDFKNLIRDRKVVSFYEERDTRQLQFDEDSQSFKRTGAYMTMVDTDSALLHLPDTIEDKVGLDSDHSLMVKFKTKNTPGYTDVVRRLRDFQEQAPSVVANRFRM